MINRVAHAVMRMVMKTLHNDLLCHDMFAVTEPAKSLRRQSAEVQTAFLLDFLLCKT